MADWLDQPRAVGHKPAIFRHIRPLVDRRQAQCGCTIRDVTSRPERLGLILASQSAPT